MGATTAVEWVTPAIAALFECELRNEEAMIRDAKARDQIPPPTTIDTVLDSLHQGLGLPDEWSNDDWLRLIEVIRRAGHGSKVEDIMSQYWRRQQATGAQP